MSQTKGTLNPHHPASHSMRWILWQQEINDKIINKNSISIRLAWVLILPQPSSLKKAGRVKQSTRKTEHLPPASRPFIFLQLFKKQNSGQRPNLTIVQSKRWFQKCTPLHLHSKPGPFLHTEPSPAPPPFSYGGPIYRSLSPYSAVEKDM